MLEQVGPLCEIEQLFECRILRELGLEHLPHHLIAQPLFPVGGDIGIFLLELTVDLKGTLSICGKKLLQDHILKAFQEHRTEGAKILPGIFTSDVVEPSGEHTLEEKIDPANAWKQMSPFLQGTFDALGVAS